MNATKKLGSLMEDNKMGAKSIKCLLPPCSNNQKRRWSVSGVHDDVLNISPRLSYHNPTILVDRKIHDGSSFSFSETGEKYSSISSITSNGTPESKIILVDRKIHDGSSFSFSETEEKYSSISSITSNGTPESKTVRPERRLRGLSSLCFSEKLENYSTFSSADSNEAPLGKTVAELVEEIETLELEVIQLERYLLSLYRTTFDQYLPSSPAGSTYNSRSLSKFRAGSVGRDARIQAAETYHIGDSNNLHDKVHKSCDCQEIEKTTDNDKLAKSSPPDQELPPKETPRNLYPYISPKETPQNVISGIHRSLAEHLSASIADHVPDIHCKLSEDVVRCISAIYCKLANPPAQQMDILVSRTPSVSSSSTDSPKNPFDTWSPQCHYECTANPCQFGLQKSKLTPYSSMVEVPKICVDGNKYDYASKMLNTYRSLIRRLDTIDPRNMEHGMQIAFWINIHNALVMHAFLAYGLHQNYMKNTSSVMKAAYSVGGHSVNPCVIQKAILGCQLHRPAQSLWTLLSPSIKRTTGNIKHVYALDHPESLAHFGLCLGAYSDPAVRVYTAKSVYQELNLAKIEFIQATVSVQKDTRIILPKILQYYAKDASLELSNLMEMVCNCMPEAQKIVIQECLKRKVDKCVEWSSYNSVFRYLVHRDLAK